MIIKLTLRKHRLRIIFTSILFLFIITCVQLAINLSNSYLTIASRAKKYNASHTEISVDLFYNLQNKITDFSQETKAFLDTYPDIEYYTTQLTTKKHFIRYEEYVDNNVDNYRVLAGKQLEDLELYEVAIPANLNDFFLDSGDTVYQLGDLIPWLSEPLVVASIIDNIHFAESSYNELTMDEPFLSWSRSYEFTRFLANRETIDYINAEVDRIDIQSTAFKISYAHYSEVEEQRLIDSYIDYIGGMNKTIRIIPFRDVLHSANGTDIVIGKTLAICSTMMFVFAILAIIIAIKRDLVKDWRFIGTLKSIGISRRTIMMTYLSEYGFASLTGYLGSMLFFLMMAIIFRGQYRYSLFFSKDVTLYLLGFGIILLALILFILMIGLIIGKTVDRKPAHFFRDTQLFSRMNRLGTTKLSKIVIGIRYAFADWFSSLQHLLSTLLIILSLVLYFSVNSTTENIYTTSNFGLDYDYLVVSKYDVYSEIMDTYGEKSLIVNNEEVWAIMTDSNMNESYVKILYVAFSGDICDFLASECQFGACPPNSTTRGQGLVGYALAKDFNLEVAPEENYSYQHFIRFADTGVGTSTVYNIKIDGIQTILQQNGYIVYDRIGDDANYAGRRFIDYFKDNINRAIYYLRLREGASREELEVFLSEQNDIYYEDSAERESAIQASSDKLLFYIRGITSVTLILTLLIFTTIMFSDFSAFFQKRRRDFGIFRSLGFSPSSSSLIFVGRYILLSLISVLMGILVSLLLQRRVTDFVSDTMGVFMEPSVNEVILSLAVSCSLFAFVIGLMILFARRASKIRIAELVRPEE